MARHRYPCTDDACDYCPERAETEAADAAQAPDEWQFAQDRYEKELDDRW